MSEGGVPAWSDSTANSAVSAPGRLAPGPTDASGVGAAKRLEIDRKDRRGRPFLRTTNFREGGV